MPEDRKIEPISKEVSPQPPLSEMGKGEEHEEGGREQEAETRGAAVGEQTKETAGVVSPISAPTPVPHVAVKRAQVKSEQLLAIERILEEGLDDTYWQLPPRVQQKFKERGEKTAWKIERMLRAVHLNALKLLRLIRKWLSTIPHANRFFLEQESKIKTDKVIALHKEQHHR